MDSVYDVILGSLTLRQCQNTAFNPTTEETVGYFSGGIDPQAFYISKGVPACTFDTEDLGTGLAIGTDTFCSSGLHTSNGTITIPFARRVTGAQFAGSSAHMRLNATYALHVPTKISGAQNQDAMMSVMSHFYLPTGKIPVTASTGITLGSQTFVAKYTMGTAFITPANGSSTQVTQVTNIVVTPGITVETEDGFYDGEVFPQTLFITKRNPTIEITTKNFDQLAAYGPVGGGVDACIASFRKRNPGGTLVADATAEHIGFSGGVSMATIQSITANPKTGEGTIKLSLKSLTCDTTYALA